MSDENGKGRALATLPDAEKPPAIAPQAQAAATARRVSTSPTLSAPKSPTKSPKKKKPNVGASPLRSSRTNLLGEYFESRDVADDEYNQDSDDDNDHKGARDVIEENALEDDNNNDEDDDPTNTELRIVTVDENGDETSSDAKPPHVPDVPNDEDVFADSLANHYHLLQGTRDEYAFSSFCCLPRNAEQWKVYKDYLAFCLGIFMLVVTLGYAFLPNPYLENCYNYLHRYLCINDRQSYVYFLRGKIGSTGRRGCDDFELKLLSIH